MSTQFFRKHNCSKTAENDEIFNVAYSLILRIRECCLNFPPLKLVTPSSQSAQHEKGVLQFWYEAKLFLH